MQDFAERFGPWALVTGASAGLGAEYANQLAARGLNVVLVARREEALRRLAGELAHSYAVEARVVVADLSVDDVLGPIGAATADIDIGLLVNNAGFANSGRLLDNDIQAEIAALHVNCRAPLVLTHHFGRRLRSRGRGGIIFVSSIAAFAGNPRWAVYGATKAFDLSLGEALFREERRHGIAVLTVCPGPVKTEFWQVAGAQPILAVSPEKVVAASLRKLGRRPATVVGLFAKLSALATRIGPRAWNTAIYGAVIKQMQGPTERQPADE